MRAEIGKSRRAETIFLSVSIFVDIVGDFACCRFLDFCTMAMSQFDPQRTLAFAVGTALRAPLPSFTRAQTHAPSHAVSLDLSRTRPF
jgi:hypothetical protein